jgi:curved DNA-binding protein CbpA
LLTAFVAIAFSVGADRRAYFCEFVKMRTLYDTLEVRPDADMREIRLAYLRQAKLYHPDKNFGDKAAGQQFNDLKVAYEFLRDHKNRRLYDAHLENTRRRLRQRKLRNGFIYGFGFATTFCAVFIGVRSYFVKDSVAPVAAFSAPQNRYSDALAQRELSGTVADQFINADRHDPLAASAEIQSSALPDRDAEVSPEPILHVRSPPMHVSPPVSEPAPRFDRGPLKTTEAADGTVNPSNVVTARASDRRQVRVWGPYRDSLVVGSQIPPVRIFAVEREGRDAGARSDYAAVETTVSLAAAVEKRDVRVRTTWRSSSSESEIQIMPHVVTVERE